MSSELPIFTIGHSTRSIDEFVAILAQGGVDIVVDIRTVPRSRHNPQYNENVIGAELAPRNIGYARIASLGGLRSRSADVPPLTNGLWQNRSFHNYADYALSQAFTDGLDALLELSGSKRCAIMCAEAVWWRCHRRIVADYLIVAGRDVYHLMAGDRVEQARLTTGALVEGTKVTYPVSPIPAEAE